MARYANRPGVPAHAPALWPQGSAINLDPNRPTLVMLVHPRCDCTQASLDELAELMARAPQAAAFYVVFMKPPSSDSTWDDTRLWRTASAIPGLTVIHDDGRETARFGAETSGQILLYGPDGHLLFSGGATPARGHEGDSLGFESLLTLLRGSRSAASQSPVFGCPLFDTRLPVAERKRP
jgi:hypothetical protein